MSKELKQTDDLRKEFVGELIDVMCQLNDKVQTSGEEKLINELGLTLYEIIEFSNKDGEVIDVLKRQVEQ